MIYDNGERQSASHEGFRMWEVMMSERAAEYAADLAEVEMQVLATRFATDRGQTSRSWLKSYILRHPRLKSFAFWVRG